MIWLVGLIGLARWIRVIPCPSVTRLIRVCPYVCVLGIGAELRSVQLHGLPGLPGLIPG